MTLKIVQTGLDTMDVLLIDDDDLFRETVRDMLDTLGYNVVEAEDGKRGIEAWRRGRADVVLTDILMPNQEGIATIRQIRQSGSDVWIVAMSGGQKHKLMFLDFARELGANRILRKPFNLNALKEAIEGST